MNEKEVFDVTTEVAKEIAKDVYEDVGHPVAKPTGELVGLIPRAIKAALSPLEKWVLQKEYNVEETRKLLEKKLENVSPDQIEAPEPHIAVPAMQYISYCMDNEELREMYANLLANSMKKVVKKGVHPGFIEIIKQLSPDEAKLLRGIYKMKNVPSLKHHIQKKNGATLVLPDLLMDLAKRCNCEDTYGYNKYIVNMLRLGLIEVSFDEHLVDDTLYDSIKNIPFFLLYKQELERLDQVTKVDYVKGFISLTEYGKAFCSVCLETQ